LWSCGVAGAGITDWSEVYELGDAVFKMFVEVLFDGKRELWKDRSAIHYVEKLKSPLCILHPQNDTRTPLRPVLKYALKLSELGKTFEMHIAPDMGHILTRMDDAMKILYPALIFLSKHMNMNDSD
jgi:dipeptidyl aminopeptidase/acylaminoacyl peptidase